MQCVFVCMFFIVTLLLSLWPSLSQRRADNSGLSHATESPSSQLSASPLAPLASETDESTGMASLRQRTATSRLQNGQATGEDKAAEAPLKVPRTPDRVDRGRWRSGLVCLLPRGFIAVFIDPVSLPAASRYAHSPFLSFRPDAKADPFKTVCAHIVWPIKDPSQAAAFVHCRTRTLALALAPEPRHPDYRPRSGDPRDRDCRLAPLQVRVVRTRVRGCPRLLYGRSLLTRDCPKNWSPDLRILLTCSENLNDVGLARRKQGLTPQLTSCRAWQMR
jgi:hypothetical protein